MSSSGATPQIANDDYCIRANRYRGCDGSCGKKHISITDSREFASQYFAAATQATINPSQRASQVQTLHVMDIEALASLPELDPSAPLGERSMILLVSRNEGKAPAWISEKHADLIGIIKLRQGFVWKMEWYAYKRHLICAWLPEKFRELQRVIYYSGDVLSCVKLSEAILSERMMYSTTHKDTNSLVFRTEIRVPSLSGEFCLDNSVFFYGLSKPIKVTPPVRQVQPAQPRVSPPAARVEPAKPLKESRRPHASLRRESPRHRRSDRHHSGEREEDRRSHSRGPERGVWRREDHLPLPPPIGGSFEDSSDEDDRAHFGNGWDEDRNRSKSALYSSIPSADGDEMNTNESFTDEEKSGPPQLEPLPMTEAEVYARMTPDYVITQFYESQCFSLRILRDADLVITPKSILIYLFRGNHIALDAELQAQYLEGVVDMCRKGRVSGKTPAGLTDLALQRLRNRTVASFLLLALTVMRDSGVYTVPTEMRRHVHAFAGCPGAKEYAEKIKWDNDFKRGYRFCANMLNWLAHGTATRVYEKRIGYCKYLGESIKIFGSRKSVAKLTRSGALKVDQTGEIAIGAAVRRKNKRAQTLQKISNAHTKDLSFDGLNLRAFLLTRLAMETDFKKYNNQELNDTLPRLWGGDRADEIVLLKDPERKNRFDRVLKRVKGKMTN